MSFLLDTCILGKITHPNRAEHGPLVTKVKQLLSNDPSLLIYVPEIADYELRRKYIHRNMTNALRRLDNLKNTLGYLPLTTEVMKGAAKIWAEARQAGRGGASDDALDGDVILAAQAIAVGGTVVTTNVKHFRGIVAIEDWSTP